MWFRIEQWRTFISNVNTGIQVHVILTISHTFERTTNSRTQGGGRAVEVQALYHFEFSCYGFAHWEDKRVEISKIFLSFFALFLYNYHMILRKLILNIIFSSVSHSLGRISILKLDCTSTSPLSLFCLWYQCWFWSSKVFST